MSDEKTITIKLNDKNIGSLENRCEQCKGDGGTNEYSFWATCDNCQGTGYIPTQNGEAILELIQHNMKNLLRQAISDIINPDR